MFDIYSFCLNTIKILLIEKGCFCFIFFIKSLTNHDELTVC